MAIENLILPKLGESIMEATIIKWNKKVGDSIVLDETIAEIATDKVDSELPSSFAGTVVEILFKENDVVPIGATIAKIETSSPNAAIAQQSMENEIKQTETPNLEVPFVDFNHSKPEIQKSNDDNRFYSPLVLSISKDEKISFSELETLVGSGNNGRVTKNDLLKYIEQKKLNPLNSSSVNPIKVTENQVTTKNTEQNIILKSNTAVKLSDPKEVTSSGLTEIIEMDRVRKIIAKNMVDSVHTSPHVTSFTEVDVTNIVLWRTKNKDLFEKREGIKLTYTPMFIECLVETLAEFPLLNSSIIGDKIIIKKDFNIGMATALENGNLIVPVIKSAEQLSIVGLAQAVDNLAKAARKNELKLKDTEGGTFTLTNVGSFGSLMGTPIILQPQVAILALGAIKKRPVVIETEMGDTIGIRQMMYISLSYDHRIIDGALGTKFISKFATNCANWDANRQWFKYL